MLFGQGAIPQVAFPELLAAGQRAFGVLFRIMEAGQHAGDVVPGEPYELAIAAWAHVRGLAPR